MKQILYTISLLFLLGACTDETYTDELSAKGGKTGKPVPVELSLSIQPQQSPLTAGTKAGSGIISSAEVCKGMEISLVETPVTPETRAADMNEVKNFWVFQFNGTEPNSTLSRKDFYTGSSVKTVTLNTSTVKNRIIVIANTDATTFASLAANNTYTLDAFNKLGISHNGSGFPQNFPLFTPSGGSPRVILAGSTDIVVTDNAQADIMLYRSTARVTVNLRLGQKMRDKYTAWTYQFMSIPKTVFYHSIGRTPVFPGSDVGYTNYQPAPISFSSPSYSTTFQDDLPVNLQHPVSYTTPEKRVTNAPAGATYLQLVGLEQTTGGTINKSVVYQIHLGSNFTDDYSVSPNYSYTYNITITNENDDDSRVIKFIPGYFGGALQKYKEDGTSTSVQRTAVTWRYEKCIEVYISDVGGAGGWKDNNAPMPAANSFMDGRANTAALLSNIGNYLAVKKCVDLNSSPTAENLVWYMPSFGQSLGIYVAGSNTLKTLPNATYWTSSTDGYDAWGTKVWTGLSEGIDPGSQYFLRCIKDLIPGNTVK